MPYTQTADPSASPYWDYFTPAEQEIILNHPLHDTAIEIELLRSLLAAFLEVSVAQPITDPELSLQALYSVSLTAAVIASLVRDSLQSDLHQTNCDQSLADAYHRARTSLGIYSYASHLGFSLSNERSHPPSQ